MFFWNVYPFLFDVEIFRLWMMNDNRRS
jgi:hypothetical protein